MKKKLFSTKSTNRIIRMMSLMGSYIWIYVIGLVASVIASVSFLILNAFVNKNMVNAVIKGDRNLLTVAIITAIISILSVCLIDPIATYVYNSCIKKIMFNIRFKFYQHMQRLPITYFDNNHSGDVMSRITNDINCIEGAYSILRIMVLTILAGVGSAISMLLLDWRLSIFLIIISLLSLLTTISFSKPIGIISCRVQEHLARLTENTVNLAGGLRIIKVFGIGNILIDKYVQENNKLCQNILKRIDKNAKLNGLNYLYGIFSFIGVFIAGCIMVSKNSTDFGTVIAMTTLQNGLSFMLFLEFGNFIAQFQGALAGADRVIEIMETEIEPAYYDINGIIDNGNKIIQLDNISFRYGEKKVLDGLHLSVDKDNTIALIGLSGSGKSTIIKLLLGFYSPDNGNITINGKELRKYQLYELRQNFAYVPQDAFLFNTTIEDNIRFGNINATEEEVVEAAKVANAHDFIINLSEGYKTNVGELGNKLSGGERQRIAIARAILKNAPILLLDEATSSLDSENEQLVQNAFEHLKRGRTVIIIAHRLSTIINADKICVVENGKIVEEGIHSKLLEQKGRYFEFLNSQFQGLTY